MHASRPGAIEATERVNPIAVTGSVAFVSIDTAAGRRERLLGGSAAHFALAARFFAPVTVTSVVGRDFYQDDFACLERCEVSTLGIAMTDATTSSWTEVYADELSKAEVLDRQLTIEPPPRSSGLPLEVKPREVKPREVKPREVKPREVKPREAKPLEAKPLEIRFESPATLSYRSADPSDCFMALDDAYSLGESPLPAVIESLAGARGVFLRATDAQCLTGENQFVAAGRRVKRLGPELVVLTHGERGASLFTEDLYCKVRAFPTTDVVDTSGAGAAFAGGFLGTIAALGAVLDQQALRIALLWATVVSSFVIEGFGVERCLTVTHEELRERYESFLPMLQVEGDSE